ncbi:MAG: serine/threonine protein kinase [Pseudomonadota bacterium]
MADNTDHPSPASSATPFYELGPDTILDAVESVGMLPTGSLLALNSFENRVYQLELEDGSFVVVKFYRPQRWSDAAIIEEHTFTEALAEEEISVVAPMQINGDTLFHHKHFRFAVMPRQGGHPPNLEDKGNLEVLARTIARMHMVGARMNFEHRQKISSQRLGHESRTFLLEHQFIPPDIEPAYESVTADLLDAIDNRMTDIRSIRLHGDSHMGNVLWRTDTPHFVDFDDCAMGPPIQDLWMLLSGERTEQLSQIGTILDAYQDFYDFDPSTLSYVEALRSLRIMYHAAWIARRWEDPAFTQAFSWFGSARYWSEHVLSLREQQALLQEPPLIY